MQEGTVVSRNEIFEDGNSQSDAEDSGIYTNFDFEEVEVDVGDTEGNKEISTQEEPEALAFQLFANSGPVQISLNEKEEEIKQGRPERYYFFTLSPQERINLEKSAVTGEQVKKEAEFWSEVISNRNFVAPDINANYRPKKKKCRPGKNARASRRLLKEKQKARQIEEERLWALRRREKPRKPLRIPSFPSKPPSQGPQKLKRPVKLGHRNAKPTNDTTFKFK